MHDGQLNHGGAYNEPPGLVRPDLLGFSAHLAWLCLFMYKVVPSAASTQGPGHEALDPAYLSSMLPLVVTLCVGIASTRPFMRVTRSRAASVAAPIACSLGTVLGYPAVSDASSGLSLPIVILSGLLTGISSALMAANWASLFGKAKTKHVVDNFTLILVIVVSACLTTTYLSAAATCVVTAALPLVSGICLIYGASYQARHPSYIAGRSSTRQPRKVYSALIALVAVMGLSTGAMTQLGSPDHSLEQLFCLLAALITLLFVGRLIFVESRREFLCLFVVPFVVLLVIAVPYFRYISTDGSGVFLPIGNAAIELMLLFESVLFALLFDFSPARTFMITRVTMAVSDLAGVLLAEMLLSQGGSSAAIQAAGVTLLIGAEVVVVAIIGTYLLLCKKAPDSAAFNTEAIGYDKPAAAPDGVSETDPAPSMPCDLKPDLADVVEGLALEHGLSPRETDVLQLLAQGRSTAQIQDTLCIAQGTLNYHMRNIYTKFDTHSRQELLVKIYAAANKQ